MNTLKIFLIITALISFNACNTNLDDIMSDEDIAALEAMEISYNAAVEANTSLANYVESTGITNDETCLAFDRVYHENDSIFEASHNMYSHNNKGDNHDSNSWMMGSGWMNNTGNMMGNGGNNEFTQGFCYSNNLDLMDSLMVTHENYHPEI